MSWHKEYTYAIWKPYLLSNKVMAKVKAFVHASHADADADADADGRAMTLAPRTYVPAR